jgi:S-DNA-T family DNA segregation ATPase FtsK/SpoIIIE
MGRKKQTKRKPASKRKQIPEFSKFLKDERVRFLLGITFSLLTIYLGIAFISFFFTGGADQSKLDIRWLDLILDSNNRVENWTGKTGAYFSNLFINKWFGIASISFLYVLVVVALRFFSVKIHSIKKTITLVLVFCIWLSVCLAFFFVSSYKDSFLFMGGAHGFFISEWLNSLVGKAGTLLLLILSFFAITVLSFNNAVQVFKKPFQKRKSTETKEAQVKDNESADKEEETILSKSNGLDSIIKAEPDTEETPEEILTEEELLLEEPTPQPEPQLNPQKTDSSQKVKKNEEDDSLELTIESEKIQEETVAVNQLDLEDYDPTLDLSNYKFPSLDLLENHQSENSIVSKEELETNKNRIVETLRNYKIEIVQIKATIGPTVTLYEIVPAPGIRISKIKNLEDDIALSLSALGIRIIAPIPGKGTIGIEVPNRTPEIVSMRSIISSKRFQESKHALPVALGKTISNETFTLDLAKMPHLLVAGATGQGKSVGLNAIITSLLYKKHPSQLKFVLVDPKKVELSIYSTIEKHFLAKLPDEEEPIITDIHKVITTLNSLCVEMDSRYDLLKKAHARNIKEYNAKFIKRKLNPENGHRYLPYIVVIIDEFADLIMTAGKEVETPIARIAQLARAIGIHMIIATQRPSTNIITGVIKANFPARIAFKVASMIDSRTILDSPGANQLIGRGDMLVSLGSDLTRVQCAFVDTPEVENITESISHQQAYPSALLLPEFIGESSEASNDVDLQKRDPLFEEAARLVVGSQQGSTSAIQRRFSIGYNRAGRIVDQLEAAGVVGPFEGSKARQVLLQDEYSLEKLLNEIVS